MNSMNTFLNLMLDEAMYLNLHYQHNSGKLKFNVIYYRKEFGFPILVKKRLSANLIHFFT